MPKEEGSREYIVVLRCASAARFAPDDYLHVETQSESGPVNLIFRTRYSDQGFSALVPYDLWVEARGPAPSLEVTIETFANAALILAPLIALSANATVGVLDIELAYDNTPGISEREFFQHFLPDRVETPGLGRRANSQATGALIRLVFSHSDRERLHRAISQYHLALSHWRLGHEALAFAHLYMGMEALTKVAVRDWCQREGLTEEELAAN